MSTNTEDLRGRILALLNNSPLPNAGKVTYILRFCKEAGLKFIVERKKDYGYIEEIDIE